VYFIHATILPCLLIGPKVAIRAVKRNMVKIRDKKMFADIMIPNLTKTSSWQNSNIIAEPMVVIAPETTDAPILVRDSVTL